MSIALDVINNFSSAANYYGSNYPDSQVWLYFLNTNGKITYTDASSGNKETVVDATAIQLSAVKSRTFQLATGEDSTKLYAALGSANPFSGTDGPGVFDKDLPYALIEWTINGNSYDNTDVTYIDTFAFPTTLTVFDENNNQTDQASFASGTTASDVITVLKAVIADKPNGPSGTNYPEPSDAAGWGPGVPTVSSGGSKNTAERWIGSSKYWISGPGDDNGTLRSMYLYAPSFQDYLGYLQQHVPTTQTDSGKITGWYIDYSSNGGYSGYLNITSDASSGYGLKVTNVRVNTSPSAANGWQADPNAGTATTGEITIVANNTQVPFMDGTGKPDGTQVSGLFTDAVIYSGAAVIYAIGTGPVVTSTGDLAPGATNFDIVPTFLASISASVATGLLGSAQYMAAYNNHTDPDYPKSTMYWFNTLSRAAATTQLFGSAWPDGQEYYDPFWGILADYTDNQGYLSPFNDRWSNFSPSFPLATGYSIKWALGVE